MISKTKDKTRKLVSVNLNLISVFDLLLSAFWFSAFPLFNVS
jgi:hypothetical protein